MKIISIKALPFAVPYDPRFAGGKVHTASHVLVRVRSDDGVLG